MVYIMIANGFEELEAISVVDLVRRAGIQINTVSIMPDKTVYGARGIGIETDMFFRACDFRKCSMIILPGGLPGTTNLCNFFPLKEEIQKFNEQGKDIAAICAAPMVLGQADVFAGRAATIYEGMEKELINAIPVDKDVVVSDNIITSKGPGTAIPFALAIIEKIVGKEKAEEIRKDILYK